MTFGKNRVQYNNFVWKFLRYQNYDVYYNQEALELAKFSGEVLRKELLECEEYFNYNLNKRVVIILYNKYSDYSQTNIGLVTGLESYNIGGVSKIINNKIIVYFEGNRERLKDQIKQAISQVFIDEILYGGQSLGSKLIGLSDYKIPKWYYDGLLSYREFYWGPEFESLTLDLIFDNRIKKIEKLEPKESVTFGHSFWFFLEYTYGKSVISDILLFTHITKDTQKAFYRVIGKSLDDLFEEWKSFFTQVSLRDELQKDSLEPFLRKGNLDRKLSQLKYNKTGEYLAWIENELGKYKIRLHNFNSNKTSKIYTSGYKVRRKVDYSYPVLTWNPKGNILSFILEDKGGIKLYFYDVNKDKLVERKFLYFEKVLSLSYSSDGTYLLFSGVRNGQSDIFTYHIPSSNIHQITNDKADDYEPYFSYKNEEIIFRSNRIKEELICNEWSSETDLFILRLNRFPRLIRLFPDNLQEESNLTVLDKDYFLFKNNLTGKDAIYTAKFDSTISFIDTAIHYRYFSSQNTFFRNENIKEYSFVPQNNKLAFIRNDDRFENIFLREEVDNANDLEDLKSFSQFVKEKRIQRNDYLKRLNVLNLSLDSLASSDTLTIYKILKKDSVIDVNHYVFEVEKLAPAYFRKFNTYLNIKSEKRKFKIPPIRLYQTTFYNNYMVSQVDFGFLSSSYQAYTGGAVYYSPGINGLMKIGANDLLEDYKLIGGVRFSADLTSNEFLLSFENLKDQWDKQFIFHRQSFIDASDESEDEYYSKVISNQFFGILTYPFREIDAVKFSSSFRQDRIVYLSTDIDNLRKKDQFRLWATLKAEYIFDNTFSEAINIYEGTRSKVFAESFLQLNDLKNDLYVFGVDFRHYRQIHRNMIFASRFAASSSFGRSRLLYYLGGVDSWVRFLNPTFDYSVPVDHEERYAYQANATNMRGFLQNIRNGNNFAVWNNEIRWPVISYFLKYPTGRSFIDNFQLVSFFDIGSAWTGLTPFSGGNAWDTETIQQGPVTVIVDSNRSPLVAGYGFGLRTQMLGYFMRFDWSWGIENGAILPGLFYFSLSLDF